MSRSIQLTLLLGNEPMERRKNVLCIPGTFYRLEMHHILSAFAVQQRRSGHWEILN
jgi:hypothetical protein